MTRDRTATEPPTSRDGAGGVQFPPTSWLLLASARDARSGDNPALAEFSERYYGAVRAYISAIVRNRLDPEELTQRFFLLVVLSGRLFPRADPAKGQFRAYLKQAIRNFVIDEFRRRGRSLSVDDRPALANQKEQRGPDAVPDSSSRADEELVRAWGRRVVAIAVARVKRLCDEKGQQQNFELFARRFLAKQDTPPGWRHVGKSFGLDEKTARSRADTVVRHFRSVLRDMIATDIGAESDADSEIRVLISLL